MILYPDGRVEGTPEEIAQWKEMQLKKHYEEWHKKMEAGSGINNGSITMTSHCLNDGKQCLCTGACTGQKYTVWHGIYPPPCNHTDSKTFNNINVEEVSKDFDVNKFAEEVENKLKKQGF